MAIIPDSQDALAWAVAAANNKRLADRYKLYRAYYDGDHDLQFATPKFKSAFGHLFEAFAYNRCAAAVDAMTDRLAVERFSIGGLDAPNTELEKRADNLWARNAMQKRETEVYTEVLTAGDAYVLVWPDPETQRPVIWPQQAHQCSVRYSDEQPDRIILGTKRWRETPAEQSRVRVNVYFPDRIERWVTQEKRRQVAGKLQPQQFIPFVDDDAGHIVQNPWNTVPLFHFANAARTGGLGVSELRDIIPINDALNKTLADMMIAEEFAAYVQKVIIGVDANPEMQDGVALNPEGAHNAEQMRRLSMGMDRIITLADPASKIGEWSSTALDQFQELGEGWDARVSRVSKVPVHYLTLSSDFPSGRALRTAEAPFVAKLESQQRNFGETWESVQILALKQDGAKLGDTLAEDFKIVWRSAAPLAEEDKWDLVGQMVTAGVPLPLAVKRIGWTEDEIAELEAKQKEIDDMTAEREIAMLTAGQMAGDEEEREAA